MLIKRLLYLYSYLPFSVLFIFPINLSFICSNFPSIWETFLSFLFQDSLFLSSLLRNIALGVKFDIDSFFPFQHFKIIASFSLGLHCFCWEKLLFISLFLFALDPFEIFSFSLISCFPYLYLCVVFFILLEIGFSNLWVDVSHQFWKLLAIYLKIFSALFFQLPRIPIMC